MTAVVLDPPVRGVDAGPASGVHRGRPATAAATAAAGGAAGAARGPWWDLRAAEPLAKVLGPLPLMVAVMGTRDVATPAAVAAVTLLVVLVGARPRPRLVLALLVGLPLVAAALTVSFGVLTDPRTVAGTDVVARVGPFELWSGALATGLSTGLRTVAVLLLALVGGLTTTGPDLVRSMIRRLHVPYRVGWAALAALRFVPRFAADLELIRMAHRVRGVTCGRGPVATARRHVGYAVPLLAGGIRHGERVALAMESRGFGAHATRTERSVVPVRAADVVLVLLAWGACAAVVLDAVAPALAGLAPRLLVPLGVLA